MSVFDFEISVNQQRITWLFLINLSFANVVNNILIKMFCDTVYILFLPVTLENCLLLCVPYKLLQWQILHTHTKGFSCNSGKSFRFMAFVWIRIQLFILKDLDPKILNPVCSLFVLIFCKTEQSQISWDYSFDKKGRISCDTDPLSFC